MVVAIVSPFFPLRTPPKTLRLTCANGPSEYRICRKSESHYDLTEECFQGKDPSRGGPLTLTDDSWIQYVNEKNRSHFKPTRECLGAFSSSWCTAEASGPSLLSDAHATFARGRHDHWDVPPQLAVVEEPDLPRRRPIRGRARPL